MRSLQRRLVLLTIALLALAAVFVSIRAGQQFEASLTSLRLAVQREVGRSAIEVIQKALSYDVPFGRLVGSERYLETVKRDNPGVDYLIVADMDGKARYTTELRTVGDATALQHSLAAWDAHDTATGFGKYFNVAAPIIQKGKQVGWLHVGERANVIEQLLRDIAFDILTVLVVASLVAFELVTLLLAGSFSTPLRTVHEFLSGIAAGDFSRYLPRDFFGGIGRLNRSINATLSDLNGRARRTHAAGGSMPEGFSFNMRDERRSLRINSMENIRWPFFLLIFAESLSLSFFPNFVAQFYDLSYGVPRHVMIGIPITVFMLVWAIAMPFAGTWCDRVGYRQAFGVGAATTTVGLILTAYSTSMVDLLLWRSVTAVGYGIVYVTTQAYITANIPPAERTRGQAMFLTSFFAGSLSGVAIGGILVDRLGFQSTFLLSAVLSALAALYVLQFLGNEAGKAATKKRLVLSDFKLLLQNKKFTVITFFSAIPAKIALAGFLYYSVPLYLKGLGYNQSITGRVMMAYGLSIILFGPMVAKLADGMQSRLRLVVFGGYAAAVAMAIPLFVEGMTGAVIAVIGLGIAHAVGVSPQMTLINDHCVDTVVDVGQATTVGIFRLVERIGTITGPILLGVMIALSDFMGAFATLAIFTCATTTIFMSLLLWLDRSANKSQTA